MTTQPVPSQYQIVYGTQRAVITDLGATLRSYQVNGKDVVTSFGEDESPQGCQGQHLFPWPNRIRDGRYRLDGTEMSLVVNEVERNNAIHGLVKDSLWQLAELYPSVVTFRLDLEPQPGWPGSLLVLATYQLTEKGLEVSFSAENSGDVRVPCGYGAHPYLTLGSPINEVCISGSFSQILETDDRLLPISVRNLSAEEGLTGEVLGARVFDTALCSPHFDHNDSWQLRLSNGDEYVELWAKKPLNWVQLYTPGDRLSIAVEPMSCAADAFNPGPTHDDLVWLSPGERFSVSWGISASVS